MEETCEVEATVPSGFEPTAQMEAKEKLGVDASYTRGKIILQVPVSSVERMKDLQSVDNIYVVIKRYENFNFENTLGESLVQIMSIIPELNWKQGLEVWQKFISTDVAIPTGEPVPDWETRLELLKKRASDIADNHTKKNNAKDATRKESEPSEHENENQNTNSTEDKDIDPTSEPASKKARKEHNPDLPSFRATCWRVGKNHAFQSPQMAAHFGGAIQEYFNWNVKMKNFDIEVCLDITDEQVSVCIALTKESKHRRHITKFGPTTLRPTIAYGMLRLCKIENGDVVCDPMCGGGSIPIEGALNFPEAKHICGDYDEKAVNRSQENVRALNDLREKSALNPIKLDILRWDCTQLPLKQSSVDVFVSDLPFGKRSGSKMRNWHLYPKALLDMARVSKLSTGRAALLTQDRKCMVKSLSSVRPFWTLLSTVAVNIGGLHAGVYILNRTAMLFSEDVAKSIDIQHPGKHATRGGEGGEEGRKKEEKSMEGDGTDS